MIRCIAEKGDVFATMGDQMLRCQTPAIKIVTADGRAHFIGSASQPPADKVGALLDKLFEFGAVEFIIAIAEKDDAIRLAAILIIDMPIGGELLEGDQKIVVPPRRRARPRAGRPFRTARRRLPSRAGITPAAAVIAD